MPILNKLWGYLAAAGAFLVSILLYNNEKNKRKQAELERDTANHNVDLLIKDKEVVTDLDILREKDNKKADEMFKKQRTQLERLKNEDNDIIVVDNIMRMYNKNNNKN